MRMGGLSFTPSTPEAWAELAKVLRRYAKDGKHATRIIDRFLEPGAPRECPTPGELAAIARDVPADPKLDRPQLVDPCEKCRDYGGNWKWNTRGGLERCDCPRGMKLAALDAARNHVEPARPTKAPHEHAVDADWARRAAGDEA